MVTEVGIITVAPCDTYGGERHAVCAGGRDYHGGKDHLAVAPGVDRTRVYVEGERQGVVAARHLYVGHFEQICFPGAGRSARQHGKHGGGDEIGIFHCDIGQSV